MNIFIHHTAVSISFSLFLSPSVCLSVYLSVCLNSLLSVVVMLSCDRLSLLTECDSIAVVKSIVDHGRLLFVNTVFS